MKRKIPVTGEIIRKFSWKKTKVLLYKPKDSQSVEEDNHQYMIRFRFYYEEINNAVIERAQLRFLEKRK